MDQTPHTCRTCSHWTPAPHRYWGAYAGQCSDLHIVHSGERTAAHYGLSEEAYCQAQDRDELPDTDTQGITWSNYSYLNKPTTWHRASLDSLEEWWSDEWERARPYVHCAPITSRLLVWLDSHTEQVVLPTGTIVDAEAFLMDREAAVYWFDPAQHAAAPVPGARVLATHRLTTTYNVADAEPFRIGKAIDMREPSTAPAR